MKSNRLNIRFYFILFLLVGNTVIANSKRECDVELARFISLVKQKDYENAHQLWQILNENCKGKHVAIYAYGEIVLKKMIELDQGTPIEESPYIDQIKVLYDNWVKYFSEEKGKVLAKKARIILDYDIGTEKEAYDLYDEAFTEDLKSFNNPKELYTYFKLSVDFYERERSKKHNNLEELLDKYEAIRSSLLDSEKKFLSVRQALLQNQTPKTKKKLRQNEIQLRLIEEAKTGLDSKLVPIMTCDDLITLYAKEFDENKNNVEWLKASSRRMILKKCTEDLLFSDIVRTLHTVEPSANTASYLAIIAQGKGDVSKTRKYYEEAYELEKDSVKKSQFAIRLAKFRKDEPMEAVKYAEKAIELNPSYGEAYLFLAELYAQDANNCGETVFEKRAVYWLSEKHARQAEKRDVLIASRAKKLAEYYKAKAPSKTEIFHEGLAGQIIEIHCWINQAILVPSIE